MLFTSLSQLEQDPLRGFVTLATFALALVTAITFHEFSHALFATRLGDPTAKALGRLSLHPKAHLDPVGTVMIFLAGFGWGKPVPVNAAYLHTGERPGMAIVSIAGPLANVVVAAIFAVLMKAGVVTSAFVGFSLFFILLAPFWACSRLRSVLSAVCHRIRPRGTARQREATARQKRANCEANPRHSEATARRTRACVCVWGRLRGKPGSR